MAVGQMRRVVQHLRQSLAQQDAGNRTDAQLLASFINQHDDLAFAAIVRRHGPMVFGVCRRVLRNVHDSEDAFQATFLVLVRKATAIVPREMLGNWLHGVAYRTAMKARVSASRRRRKETHASKPDFTSPEEIWHDLQPVLDEELQQLPEKYRLPIVVCDLEGKTWKEAARRLGWPEGTLATRLSRGRSLLAKRLRRRGLALSVALLGQALSRHAAAGRVPHWLLSHTVKAARLFAAGEMAATPLVSTQVAALTQGVLRAMLLKRLKTMAWILAVLVAGSVGGATGLFSRSTALAQEPTTTSALGNPFITEAEPPPTHATPKIDEQLKGTWVLQSVKRGGRRLPVEQGSVQLAITNRYLIWQEHGEDRAYTYQLGAGKNGRALDLTLLTDGETGSKKTHAIYEIHSDELRICESDGPRPTELSANPGTGLTLFVYRRLASLPSSKATGSEWPTSSSREASWADNLFWSMGKPRHDFGTLPPGKQARYRFQYRNIYQVPMQITGVRTSSGSVTTTWNREPVPPGEVGWIDVVLDTSRLLGRRTMSIYVNVGTVYVSTTTLQVSVDVRPDKNGSDEMSTENGSKPGLSTINHRTFAIPFAIEATGDRQGIKKIVLYSSRDHGQTWTKVAEQSPEAKQFQFTAPEDGVYWFAIQTTWSGDEALTAGKSLTPALKVLVRTTP